MTELATPAGRGSPLANTLAALAFAGAIGAIIWYIAPINPGKVMAVTGEAGGALIVAWAAAKRRYGRSAWAPPLALLSAACVVFGLNAIELYNDYDKRSFFAYIGNATDLEAAAKASQTRYGETVYGILHKSDAVKALLARYAAPELDNATDTEILVDPTRMAADRQLAQQKLDLAQHSGAELDQLFTDLDKLADGIGSAYASGSLAARYKRSLDERHRLSQQLRGDYVDYYQGILNLYDMLGRSHYHLAEDGTIQFEDDGRYHYAMMSSTTSIKRKQVTNTRSLLNDAEAEGVSDLTLR